ncbi:hypothetical protein [Halanaerobacter jeridensis]|uniref:Uncharacterized protein n=1 Tax=Halanaerobacter jeridensis TaxID=706427 RepID=A0A938XSW3_9FIRM|nr:hypothetical protein [Halanaerobacter jeridensis]MBM7557219.1 hypothetical protein [Halanaerobacter jeridensis]
MSSNQVEEHFLESFVDVATELLTYSKQKSNPPTPSLNDFSKSDLNDQEIVITNEEAEEILNILSDLQEQLEAREDKINQLQTKVKKSKSESSPQKKKVKRNFKSDLREHAETLDLITVLIQSGSNCCELKGNLFRVYHDFIILLDENNDLIKIKINKIAAIKVINNEKKNKKDIKRSDNDSKVNTEPPNNKVLKEKSEKELQAV